MTLDTKSLPSIVYVHTGFAEKNLWFLWTSIFSARAVAPSHPCICLVPVDEWSQIEKSLPVFLRDNIRWIPVETPAGNVLWRSRWLKTQVWRYAPRPCLFVDSDVLFVRSPDWSETSSISVGSALNRVGFLRELPVDTFSKDAFAQVGWEYTTAIQSDFRNSGVLFWGNDKAAANTGEVWHRLWTEFQQRGGGHYDQPAFNRAIAETNEKGRLPDTWNAPVGTLPQSASGAAIFHYYGSSKESLLAPYSLYGALQLRLRRPSPDLSAARNLLIKGRPFVGPGARARVYWLSGQYGFFMGAMMHKIFARTRGNQNS